MLMNIHLQSKSRGRKYAGFTIVELMIATSIFSLVLILITTGILRFTREYYKGVILGRTQNTARLIVDDVTRAIQFNGGTVESLTVNGAPESATNPIVGKCIGQAKRYRFYLNSQVTDNPPIDAAAHQHRHALVSDSETGCSGAISAPDIRDAPSLADDNARELISEHMRLAKFDIEGTGDVYTVAVRVVYGDDDLLCSPSVSGNCDPGATTFPGDKTDLKCRSTAGSQFCAVSELSTTVNKRVR
jgi:type II secretory pathway pseudopilin PulG